MVLRDFIVWLCTERPSLSQSEIARRSGISQSFVNKLVRGGATKEPSTHSYARVVSAFEDHWRRFLVEVPEAAEELRERYGWVLLVNAQDPQPGLARDLARLEEQLATLQDRLGPRKGRTPAQDPRIHPTGDPHPWQNVARRPGNNRSRQPRPRTDAGG